MKSENVVRLPLDERRFDAASRGRMSLNWLTSDTSPNAEVLPAISTLRQRSRDLVRNNAYAARAVSVLSSNIIGDGIKPRPKTGVDKLDQQVVRLWREWSDEVGFDGIQYQAVKSMIESGEALVRLYTRRPGSMDTPVPLMLRVLEGDHLDGNKLSVRGPRIVGGIQYDPVDDVEGYWLYQRHPGDADPLSLASSFTPAANVCHLYREDRPGQSRGLPWLSPVISMLAQVGEYQAAAIMKAKVESCMVGAMESEADLSDEPIGAEQEGAAAILDATGQAVEKFAPGMILQLPPGRSMTFFSPSGQGDFEPFLLHLLYACASGIGVTFDQLTGDLRQANFSSLRAGKVEQRRLVEHWQYHLVIPQLCRKVWRRFIADAIAFGALPRRAAGYPVEWIAPSHEPVDPLKEGQAMIEMIKAGLLPPSWAAAQLGYDMADLIQAYQSDKAAFEAAGLDFEGLFAAAPADEGSDDDGSDDDAADDE